MISLCGFFKPFGDTHMRNSFITISTSRISFIYVAVFLSLRQNFMFSYQSVTTENDTTYAQGCYIWTDWVINFSSLIHGSHGTNLQKPATIGLFTHPYCTIAASGPELYCLMPYVYCIVYYILFEACMIIICSEVYFQAVKTIKCGICTIHFWGSLSASSSDEWLSHPYLYPWYTVKAECQYWQQGILWIEIQGAAMPLIIFL